MKRLILLLALCGSHLASSGANYFVATDGSDSASGSIEAPFATIQRAVKQLKAGDICYVRGGLYREAVELTSLRGSAAKPIQIKAYDGEKVTFDGTLPIKSRWTKTEDGIYQTKADFPLWQLFVGGKSMISARYPNGNWYDGSVWKKESAMVAPEEGSVPNHFVHKGLSSFDFSMESGGQIIVNSSSWGSSVSKITQHTAGSDNFQFDPSTVKYRSHKDRISDMNFFLEGCREFIDSQGEWFFDPKTMMIYLYPMDGVDPNEMEVSGKVSSYAFSGVGCSYLSLQGFDFFGTTFSFDKSHDIRVEDCDLLYPTYSKRMLGNIKDFDVTKMLPTAGKAAKEAGGKASNFELVNCTFEYIDGPAFTTSGRNILIDNCYMGIIDYSCVVGDAAAVMLNNVENLTFRHNTIYMSGASATLQLGGVSLIEYNDISQTGFLQHDGALVQARVGAANGTIIRHNWLHDTIKAAIRTDNINKPGSPFGVNCTAHNNVSWRNDRGTFFKGDKHFVYNNLCFDNVQRDLIISSNKKINGFNYSTITRNNIANTFSGHQSAPKENYPVPGVYDHNWVGEDEKLDVRSQLRDPDNLDFRPRKESDLVDAGEFIEGKELQYLGERPDIGAYEYGDTSYWIAGFRGKKASVAIPANGTSTAAADCDLMWLGAYKATEYKIYFGESADNLKLIATQENNIVTSPALSSGKSYFWRVDCKTPNGISSGDTWSFKVK